ncbi:MAG: radical SAM family heme chaperone HemW [Alphaproteobacteria bacterium]|nr:radical SAM family heme chaperone HemW [Alphaproteobacteria bacterium]
MSRPLSIYIHYPYCISKCRYCAFSSCAARGRNGDELLSAYLKELDFYAGVCGGREVVSVYFGGGTPSLASVEFVSEILARAGGNWRLASDCEITLEANPATCDVAKLRAFREVGVNRLSIGVQSTRDSFLRWLGRAHTAAQAVEFVEAGAEIFPNYNVDLMYGLAGQTLADWEAELARWAHVPHLSLYQLGIEPGTAFARAGVAEAGETLAVKMFAAAGRAARRYEVSNYAAPGFESRHNVGYWSGRDYIGIGPAAAGRLCVEGKFFETKNPCPVEKWLAGSPKLKPLSRMARAREAAIMGLRQVRGIDMAEFEANIGIPLSKVLRLHESLAWGRSNVRFKKSAFLKMDALLAEIII